MVKEKSVSRLKKSSEHLKNAIYEYKVALKYLDSLPDEDLKELNRYIQSLENNRLFIEDLIIELM